VQTLDQNQIERNSLALGKSAMGLTYSNQLIGYQLLTKNKLGITMVPSSGPGTKSGHYYRPALIWSIGSTTKNADKAAAFISFFVNDVEAGKILGVERGVPMSPKVREAILPNLNEVERATVDYVNLLADKVSDYPPPVPLCAQSPGGATWAGVEEAQFGRLADEPWEETCNLAPDSAHSWWKAWRENVFYARAPHALDIVGLDGRLIARGRDAAVIVAGPPLVRDGFVQQRDDTARGDPRQWLEGTNALLESARGCAVAPAFACEGAGTCTRITQDTPRADFNDVVLAIP